MKLPLVTIGAINYNNTCYVLETLESIKAQTYPNIELVIVDDASTDDSLCKIRNWLAGFERPFKLIAHSKNEGVHRAYESVIRNAGGAFISFIATDDLMEPYKIDRQIDAFQSLGKEYGVVYGDVVEIDENSNIISNPYFEIHKDRNKDWSLPQGDVFTRVSREFLIYVQATLIRTSILKDFSFRYRALSEDWQLILFLSRHCRFFGIEHIVARYRRHPVSISTQNRRKERYHLWCQSNALMFYEAYQFVQNNKREKKIIADRIEFDMSDYARQPFAKNKEVIKTWKHIRRLLPLGRAYKILALVFWLRLKLFIKGLLFVKHKRREMVLQN